jgi:hypothetical protein
LDVLERARAERWTGFMFNPADVPVNVQSVWAGIDYLGESWPPACWAPPDLASFTSVDEWIDASAEVGHKAYDLVRRAINAADRWADQAAIDRLASFVEAEPPPTVRSDFAAKLYLHASAKCADRLAFDDTLVERARQISIAAGREGFKKRHGR